MIKPITFDIDVVIEFLRDDSLSIRIGTAMKERVELFGEFTAEVFHADWEVMDFKIHKKTPSKSRLFPP